MPRRAHPARAAADGAAGDATAVVVVVATPAGATRRRPRPRSDGTSQTMSETMELDAAERFQRVVKEDGRYPAEAYDFLFRALDLATRRRYTEAAAADQVHHVTGRELCEATRHLALERWGPLARDVLSRWNIHRTRDFGEMVFLMVNHSFMGRQDSDRIEDFDDVYSFRDAFGNYEIPLDNLAD
jgi:uncharacterized repeat protein (TIGR04138 family)